MCKRAWSGVRLEAWKLPKDIMSQDLDVNVANETVIKGQRDVLHLLDGYEKFIFSTLSNLLRKFLGHIKKEPGFRSKG